MRGPAEFVQHLAEHGYHPRSDAHSNAISRAILRDIIEHCPTFADRAKAGEIVAKINHKVRVGYEDWTIDLAIGRAPDRPEPPDGEPIRWGAPAVVQIALEAKSVMTEHGKARHNRLRDLHAFYGFAHRYGPQTIAAGTIAVNLSAVFWSPLRAHEDITLHHNISTLGPSTIDLFRSLPLRHSAASDPGFEAFTVIALKMDNLARNEHRPAGAPKPRKPSLVSTGPAPAVGDSLHYSTMVRRLCTAYSDRWA